MSDRPKRGGKDKPKDITDTNVTPVKPKEIPDTTLLPTPQSNSSNEAGIVKN